MHLRHVTYHEILLTAWPELKTYLHLSPPPHLAEYPPTSWGWSSGSCQLVVATSSGHVFSSMQRLVICQKKKKIPIDKLTARNTVLFITEFYFIITRREWGIDINFRKPLKSMIKTRLPVYEVHPKIWRVFVPPRLSLVITLIRNKIQNQKEQWLCRGMHLSNLRSVTAHHWKGTDRYIN